MVGPRALQTPTARRLDVSRFALALVAFTLTAATATSAPYYYVDWTTANVAAGTASGVITLPDGSTVTVNFAATFSNGSPGNLNFAQTNGGTNYWIPSAPYISSQVSN